MPTPSTFKSFFATQPPSVQNLVGSAIMEYTERDINQFVSLLSSTDEIAIFGDGSVKDGRGSHATRVYADNEYTEETPALESAAITSGDPDTITSLRSETSSLLSGLYILNLLSIFYSMQIEATVHFYYDNCESLRRVDTLDEFEYFADPLATDFDIWAEIKRISGTMTIKTETHHVKAHQDRHKNYEDLPRDAQVNCDMDTTAEEMRESDSPTPPVPIFQSNKIAIKLGNIVVTDQINKRLRNHFTAPPLQEYLKSKFRWSEEIFRTIDWITMGKYMHSVPKPKLTNLIKLQHGWQHTNTRKKMIQGDEDDTDGMSDTCPLRCGHVEEDHHYLTCTAQPGYKQIRRETQSLDGSLTKLGTHPDLRNILIRTVRTFLTGGTPTLVWDKSDKISDTIKAAFREQEEIGWQHLFLGRISMKWKYAQHQYLSQQASLSDEPLPKSKSAQTWATNLCKRLMHLALNRWQIRNEAYHDSASKFGYACERQNLISDITTRYFDSLPDHPAVNRLMSNSFEDLVTGTNSTMRTWKTSFDLVMKFITPRLITSYLG